MSTPLYEDRAQHQVGAQQPAALPSEVLENNAHSQLDNRVAPNQSSKLVDTYLMNQQGDRRWQVSGRASFPTIAKDANAPGKFQEVLKPYKVGNVISGTPVEQKSLVTPYQQNLRLPDLPIELPFIKQTVGIPDLKSSIRQSVSSQAVQEPLNHLPFVRVPESVDLPFISDPVQQHTSLSNGAPVGNPISQPLVPLNPLPPLKPFVPHRVESFERPAGEPVEIVTIRPLFMNHASNQQLPSFQQNIGQLPGNNGFALFIF